MISISTQSADANGSVILQCPTISYYDNTARVSRVKLLDGGAYILHSGVSDGDRTLNVSTRVCAEQSAALLNIFTNYQIVIIVLPDGIFLGVISYLKTDQQKADITILIQEREV